jgi:putative membrane protein
VLTALAAAAPVFHPGMWHPGFFPFFFLIPIFWILVIGLIIFLVARGRRRAWARMAAANGWQGGPGFGPWGRGGWAGGWGHGGWAAARGAEATLAERFAQGDIDEQEYRARLEVLRANAGGPQGPVPPQG